MRRLFTMNFASNSTLDNKGNVLPDFPFFRDHKLCHITTWETYQKLNSQRQPIWIKSRWLFLRTLAQSYVQSRQNCLTTAWWRDDFQVYRRCQPHALLTRMRVYAHPCPNINSLPHLMYSENFWLYNQPEGCWRLQQEEPPEWHPVWISHCLVHCWVIKCCYYYSQCQWDTRK